MARNGYEGGNGVEAPAPKAPTARPVGSDRLPTNAVEGLAYAGKKWGFQAILLLLACGFIYWQASTSRKDSRESAATNFEIQMKTVEAMVGLRSDFAGLRADTQASIVEQRGIRADVQANTAQLREVEKALERLRPERYASPNTP